ncbi:hypothetical protein ElyMa_006764800 [Elysia marginata]|uniref:Uncharacterized protein n=1 Tax=Elysia marginata TaxID=1093978 RepID=A0AAV4IYF4_9GAST|nr:hypothetical protein ElyMa_006764800 [Elysia marginata]
MVSSGQLWSAVKVVTPSTSMSCRVDDQTEAPRTVSYNLSEDTRQLLPFPGAIDLDFEPQHPLFTRPRRYT